MPVFTLQSSRIARVKLKQVALPGDISSRVKVMLLKNLVLRESNPHCSSHLTDGGLKIGERRLDRARISISMTNSDGQYSIPTDTLDEENPASLKN